MLFNFLYSFYFLPFQTLNHSKVNPLKCLGFENLEFEIPNFSYLFFRSKTYIVGIGKRM
jgi:hypothetical protein